MNESTTLLDADDVDEATIDGAVDGVSSGHGVLASMMSWMRDTVARALGPGRILGGVPVTPLADIDPKLSTRAGAFDPAALMTSLLEYERRYRGVLNGSGLLVRVGQSLPPSAFPTTASLDSPEQLLDTTSFHLEDFETPYAGIEALERQRFSKPMTVQFSWLVNATLVRAAVEMAPFVFATPRLTVDPKTFKPTLAFEHGDEVAYVNISPESSPLSLHRYTRTVIQGIWRAALSRASVRVQAEFMDAMAAQRLPQNLVDQLTHNLKSAFLEHTPLNKMRGSSAAFISIKTIFDTCVALTQNFDRLAGRNAVRHSSGALNWANYVTHANAAFKAEVAAGEAEGSLAFAGYSDSLLKAIHDSARVGGSNFNTFGYGGREEPDFEGGPTRVMLESLVGTLNDTARRALVAMSPRYLVVLACGHPSIKPLEVRAGADADPEHLNAAMATAGRRLALALNAVAESTPAGRPMLPWARVLTSRPAYDLLLSDESDERAVYGLTNLIGYANALRQKGQTAKQNVWDLPSAIDAMDAPAEGPVGALVGAYSRSPRPGTALAEKAATTLLRDFVAGLTPVETSVDASAEFPASKLSWNPEFGAVLRVPYEEKNLRAGFRLIARHTKGRKGTFSMLEVLARTSADFSPERQERHEENSASFAFAIRGTGTPDSVSPLVLEVRVPRESRLRQVVDKPPKTEGWVNVDSMRDIAGTGVSTPYMASRVADADRAFLPRMFDHSNAAVISHAERLKAQLARRPYESAVLFPAVALFMWRGGKLSDRQVLRPLGSATAFRLARASVGADNAHGMGYICRMAAKPAYRSKSGKTILDVALESAEQKVALGALEGLAKNGRLTKGELAELVEASLPKLIERHIELLPKPWRPAHNSRRRPT